MSEIDQNLEALKGNGLLDAKEVAGILQIHPRTVQRLIVEQKELPAIRVGGRWRVRRIDLLEYIRMHSQGQDMDSVKKLAGIKTSSSTPQEIESPTTSSDTSVASFNKQEILSDQGTQKAPFDEALLSKPTHFVGRGVELDRLMNRLRMRGMIGITAIRGLGGIGKTALAAVAVHKLRKEGYFHDGIGVVLCQNNHNALEVLQQVLARFDPQDHHPERSDFADLAEKAYRLLNEKDALVVLDNIEPGLEIDKVVAPLRMAGITLLLTARQMLSHTTVPVDAVITLGLLSKEEALDLFAHALGRGDATQFSTHEYEIAERIVDILDRHTLAVRLAGAYAADMHRDLEVLANELENPQRAIELPEGEMPQAAKHVFTQSTEALPPATKALFIALAVFANMDFSRNAVLALARGLDLPMPELQTNLLVLRGLLDASVNTSMPRISDHERLRLHPLLGALAASEFATLPEDKQNVVYRALASYYAEYTNRLSSTDLDPDEISRALGPDETNIIHILRWAHEHGENELVAAVCSGMQYFWSRYRIKASLEYLPWGIEAAEAIGKEKKDSRADLLRVAKLELSYGKALQLTNGIDNTQGLERLNQARNYYERSRAIAEAVEDPQSEGMALCSLGRLARQLGNLDQAESYYEEALPVLRLSQDQREEGYTYAHLGQIQFNRGDLKRAKEFYEKGLSIHRKVGYRSGEGWILGYLGQLAISYKQLDEAENFYYQYLKIADELQLTRSIGVCFSFLGEIALAREQYEEAESSLYRALDIFIKEQDRQSEGWVFYFLGMCALARKQYDEAENHLEEALIILDTANNLRGKSLALTQLALLAEIHNDLDLSEKLYRKSLDICCKLKARQVIANVQVELGRFLIERRDNHTEGCAMLSSARRYYAEMDLPMEGKAKELMQRLICEE